MELVGNKALPACRWAVCASCYRHGESGNHQRLLIIAPGRAGLHSRLANWARNGQASVGRGWNCRIMALSSIAALIVTSEFLGTRQTPADGAVYM